MGTTEKLLVSVRLRPLNEKEIARNDVSDWECLNENSIIFKNNHLPVPERSMYPTVYTFDRVFRSNSSTKQVYEEGAKEVALSVVSGINSTVFAYGQTSSGKTYTMTGITEFTVADIYDYMEKHNEREYNLKFSAMEIYNESVRDLLSTDCTPLRLLDDPERGTVVEKLTEEPVGDWNHLMELLSFCEAQRQIGETALNETSSRSHQIIRLTIESSAREFLSKDSSTLAASVNFVDLAGSERASQSLSAGTRLKEGCHINRSLLTLGTVIRKLSKGRIGHIPFRDSKLTRILQSSLGGNARTAIICTMSPARSHIEQSRNTLLFASCAKEVTTNAQVNVFMSDKALVKHLQRELARLETELRSPVSTFPVSHYSALLREKDLHIEKLEKEIIDLILQRDVAQSQIQDLLRLVGDDCDSMKSVGLNNYPHLRVQRSPECENPKSGTSPLVADPHSLDVGVISFDRYLYSDGHSQSSSDDHYIQLPDFEQDFQQNDTSLQLLVNTSKFITSNSVRSWGGIEEKTNGTSEDLCKEVRCIETEESTSTDQHSISNRSFAEENAEISELTMDGNGDIAGQEYVSLSLKEDRELSYVPLFVAPPEKPSAWPLTKCMQSTQNLKLTKSRSCKASLTTSPSSQWFENVENNENTPPNGSEKDFPGRPEGIRRKLNEFNHGADVERLLRKDSQSSMGSAAAIELEAENEKTLTDDNITKRTNARVSELEDKAELQEEKPADDDGPVHEAVLKVMESLKNVKDVGLDPIEGDSTSLSNWPTEFKRLQTEIIELWDDCNVSLVHRTYFFLLFKGEPTDSIYMEVELRRLSFLKDTFSRGSKTIEEGRTLSPASSKKALLREREMLSKQMQKRLSEQERESLFLKWGIKLNSKNRRLQLAFRLWTDTEDMDHIADSAFIVAKLVRFIEPGKAPKEMFGLNFAPQPPRRRSYSLKRSVISLL
ncbi:Kinesin-like protein [Actinidia chinensis var. chinensis]|uniref:Kinesin-like protein n=1 Tax=Actinidia chinensis var. chinensis TaxID=1590841 RepID=A0A2R6RIQ9_ACTCC|nr:Kinesin-like protein [Actinidia chinensis var. chinensis]